MPSFTSTDRALIEAESTLWNVNAILDVLPAGNWTQRIRDINEQIVTIAQELREHNDQFEED